MLLFHLWKHNFFQQNCKWGIHWNCPSSLISFCCSIHSFNSAGNNRALFFFFSFTFLIWRKMCFKCSSMNAFPNYEGFSKTEANIPSSYTVIVKITSEFKWIFNSWTTKMKVIQGFIAHHIPKPPNPRSLACY